MVRVLIRPDLPRTQGARPRPSSPWARDASSYGNALRGRRPFRRVPVPRPPFGRRTVPPGSVARASGAGLLARAMMIGMALDLADDYFTRPSPPNRNRFMGGGWQLRRTCNPGFRNYYYCLMKTAGGTPSCLTGQAIGALANGPLWGNQVVLPTHVHMEMWGRNNPPGSGGSFALYKAWTRPAQDAGLHTIPVTVPFDIWPGIFAPRPQLDPNIRRVLPDLADPPGFVPDTQTEPLADPATDDAQRAADGLAVELGDLIGIPLDWVGPGVGVVIQPGLGTDPDLTPGIDGPGTAVVIQPDTGVVISVPPSPRAPPGEGVKERKTITKSKALVHFVLKRLDEVSELSEIVDAMFEALPKDIRRKWERKYARHKNLADQAGQYGIDGADWKMQALWHNWHSLDVNRAWKNIAKNLFEDQIYGQIHKRLPPGAARAMQGGFRSFSEWLNGFLSTLD